MCIRDRFRESVSIVVCILRAYALFYAIRIVIFESSNIMSTLEILTYYSADTLFINRFLLVLSCQSVVKFWICLFLKLVNFRIAFCFKFFINDDKPKLKYYVHDRPFIFTVEFTYKETSFFYQLLIYFWRVEGGSERLDITRSMGSTLRHSF